jgi:hypothetical protein
MGGIIMTTLIPNKIRHTIKSDKEYALFIENFCPESLISTDFSIELTIDYGTREKPAILSGDDFYNNEIAFVEDFIYSGRIYFKIAENRFVKIFYPNADIYLGDGAHLSAFGKNHCIFLDNDNCEIYSSNGEIRCSPSGKSNKIFLYDSTYTEGYCSSKNCSNTIKAYKSSKIVCSSTDDDISLYDNSFLTGKCFSGKVSLFDYSNAIITDNATELIKVYDYSTLIFHPISSEIKIKYKSYDQNSRCVRGYNTIIVTQDEKLNYCKKYNIKYDLEKNTATLYKAVHKKGKVSDGGFVYHSDFDESFTYQIGEWVTTDEFSSSRVSMCAPGIHVAPYGWAVGYGLLWPDVAILELQVNIDDIVIPYETNGKVRVPKAFVTREVPIVSWDSCVYDDI